MSDAVVIGSGPNGLVAANLLADRGWSVLVLEAQPELGGAVRTDTEVHPDFRHDTFSAFYPFAAASRTIADLDLESHGLRWVHAPSVLGHPLPDGTWAVLHREREQTAVSLDALHPGDGDAWLELCRQWDGFGPDLVGALLSPFPPVRHGLRTAYRLPRAAGLGGIRMALSSVRRLGEQRFSSEGARLLLAGNALHADFAPESAGSGIFGLIMTMLAQTVGFPAPLRRRRRADPGSGPAVGVPGRSGADLGRGRGRGGAFADGPSACGSPTAPRSTPAAPCSRRSRLLRSTDAWWRRSTCRTGYAADCGGSCGTRRRSRWTGRCRRRCPGRAAPAGRPARSTSLTRWRSSAATPPRSASRPSRPTRSCSSGR